MCILCVVNWITFFLPLKNSQIMKRQFYCHRYFSIKLDHQIDCPALDPKFKFIWQQLNNFFTFYFRNV